MGVRHTAKSEQARARLVAALCQKGALCSETVAQAFLTVPREAFVPCFYEQRGGFIWFKCTPDALAELDWIETVYQDEPLVTRVDAHHMAMSSSSAPTVMAMMLEALEIAPGMSVLEIGTGSGYNAAILAHIVGDAGFVTTIDLEEDLVRAARESILACSGVVSVHQGDGRLGVPERAPFDRIVATASAPGIPGAWYEQLAVGGCMVMDLQGSLRKSSFLVLEKHANGSVEGHFDQRYLYFMPLRPGESLATRPVARLLREPVTQHIERDDISLLETRDFLWFLQWSAQGISLAKSRGGADGRPFFTLIDPPKETILQLYLQDGKWSGHQRGKGNVWETIQQAYEQWMQLGSPGLEAYHVVWDHQQACFFLVLNTGLSFPLQLPSIPSHP